jgi:hypothetical protein
LRATRFEKFGLMPLNWLSCKLKTIGYEQCGRDIAEPKANKGKRLVTDKTSLYYIAISD